jgi:hypothetical protein
MTMSQMNLKHSQARLARLEQLAADQRLPFAQRRAVNHMIYSQRAALRLRVMALGYKGMHRARR